MFVTRLMVILIDGVFDAFDVSNTFEGVRWCLSNIISYLFDIYYFVIVYIPRTIKFLFFSNMIFLLILTTVIWTEFFPS